MKMLLFLITATTLGCGTVDPYEPWTTAPADPCPIGSTDPYCSKCEVNCNGLLNDDRCRVYDSAQDCCPRDFRHCMVQCTQACPSSSMFMYLGAYECAGTTTSIEGYCR